MTHWICVHCDHRFERDAEEAPDCPRCERSDGVERYSAGRDGGPDRPSSAPRWLALIAIVVLGGGTWWWLGRGGSGPDDVVVARLRERLAAGGLQGRAEELARFAWPGEQVRRLVGQLGGGDAGRLLDALGERLKKAREQGRWRPAPRHEPATGPVRSAEQVAGLLLAGDAGEETAGDGGRDEPPALGSLELSALALAVLRAAGEEGRLAQSWALEGRREPPDPTGLLGDYGLALGPSGATWRAAPGRDGQGEAAAGGWRALDAPGEVAAVLVVEGARRLVHEGDVEQALQRARAAVALDPKSAPARLLLGLALVQSGDGQGGLEAIEAARRLGQGPAAELVAATVLLATGDADGAARALGRALEAAPDYAEAHAMLGAVHLARGNAAEAEAEVAEAARLAADLPALPMLQAELALRAGNPAEAVAKAKEAARRRPRQWEVQLQAGRIYRMVGDYDAMREAARRALSLVPETRKEMVRRLALGLLGPTAFDETSEEIAAQLDAEEGADEAAAPADDTLRLPDPSAIGQLELDGAGGTGGLAPPGGLQLGGSQPKLRLREPDEDLQLRLQP